MYQIFVIRQMVQKTRSFYKELHILFIYFKKLYKSDKDMINMWERKGIAIYKSEAC